MKKAFVLIVLLLAMLPSLAAAPRLYIKGYRIGDSEVTQNDGRIVATNTSGQVVTDIVVLESNCFFNV